MIPFCLSLFIQKALGIFDNPLTLAEIYSIIWAPHKAEFRNLKLFSKSHKHNAASKPLLLCIMFKQTPLANINDVEKAV
jgi:hypothetical protein